MQNKYKKDYSQNNYSNPILKNRIENILILRKKILFFIFIFSFFITAYLIIYSPLLKINHITIISDNEEQKATAEEYLRTQMSQKRFYLFPQNNIIFFNKNQYVKKIKSEYIFKNIILKKSNFNDIYIELIQKEVFFVILYDDIYYILNENGEINNKISEEKLISEQIVININSSNSLDYLKNSILNKNFVDNLTILVKSFKERYSDIPSSFFLTEESSIKIEFDGYYILFNLNNDIIDQFEHLLKLQKDIFIDNKIEYIDLRFDNRIYFK